MPEPTKIHLKRGRWERIGDHEICVTETTIRGFYALKRPVVDKELPKSVELGADKNN